MNAQSPAPFRNPHQPGALPRTLRQRDLVMTGQFLHEAALKQNLFFDGEGDVPRSFTVLISLGHKAGKGDNLDLARNGIVVVDNDNWRIVADSCLQQPSGLRGTSRDQRQMFAEICSMDWQRFVSFCRSQATYRAGSPDIDQAAHVPACGSMQNQQQLGLRNSENIDERSDFLRVLHDGGEYNLPPISRDGMIKDLMLRQTQKQGDTSVLSWDLGMNFKWDRSGRIDDGQELSRQLDRRWMRELQTNPDILSDACEKEFSPYLQPGFNVLEMGSAAACSFSMGGEDDRYLLLSKFGDQDMSFSGFPELRQKLTALETDKLLDLWATVRVLDKDLSRGNRIYDVAWELNATRASCEERWLDEVEEEISFAM